MGIHDYASAIRKCRKSLLHLTLLTSIVAAACSTASASAPEPISISSTTTTTTAATTTTIKSTQSQATEYAGPVDDSMSAETSGYVVDKNRAKIAIPFCDSKQENTIGRRLLYVSTLDGRLSALDITRGGKLRWSIATGPGPLVSSSIHRLELTNNGQFVRMIPSLSGGIYKFDGQSIDPIPITTDNLLSSSAKFSDDLVISGGKETRTYGVSARTGQTLYECSMHGCVNATDSARNASAITKDDENYKDEKAEGQAGYVREHDPLVDDVIVVRRQTQTVRAVETRTGVERWNFSVGQHELDLIRSAECHDRVFSEMDMAILDLDVKVIVPEGVVCAFSKLDPTAMLWKYKFDHPIVSAWKIGSKDELESIDMFSSVQWLWEREDNNFDMPLPSMSPSIYLGMYEKQLYIQESVHLRREIVDQSNLYSHLTADSTMPKIPWRPIAAGSNSLVIYQQDDDKIIGGGDIGEASNGIKGNELVPYNDEQFALSAQSVLNASEYVNGNGFFLFSTDQLEQSDTENICNASKSQNNSLPAIEDSPAEPEGTNNNSIEQDLGFNLDDIDAPVKVVILSLWFWWKEIVVIAFTSAVLLNLFVGQRNRDRQVVIIERHVTVPLGIEATESSTAAIMGPTTTTGSTNTSSKAPNKLNGHRSLSESTSNSGEHFCSRFQSDFDMMQCLGRGGFGVVFEAKNKLDDCKYAIKRITLPNKEESRMRVMREVKTLANCEHHNIVRYFQSWVEKPPPGWQEEEDNKWLAQEMSTSIQIDTPTDTHSVLPEHGKWLNKEDKKQQLQSWMQSMASTACSSDYSKTNDRASLDEEDDDSCIIFRSESQSLAMREDSIEEEEEKVSANNSNETRKARSHHRSISIDIQNTSLEINGHPKSLDYSQLSDSFQIEFVGSTNGHEDPEGIVFVKDGNRTGDNKSEDQRKKRPKDLALTISSGGGSNSCRDLLPLTNGRPAQTKVYLYIQMQLCRKESLRDWLRDNVRENRLEHIPSIFHQIVDAVDYVHLKGLIHRDLKPSNIFFSQEGQIKIGDFGLVTDMADIPNMVNKCGDRTGMPSCARHTQQVGTHLYMSPEQLQGLPYDFKVDIYSLGLIFFELLVYFGTEMERIMTLRSLRDGIYPKGFAQDHPKEYELLRKMLSAKPEERPGTADLKQKLTEILKLPEVPSDMEAAALAAAARRLSRSRTFSSSE